MKLITKNLTGHLPNGDRFRILLEDRQCEVVPSNRIVSVIMKTYYQELENWFFEDSVCAVYTNKNEYKEALKRALLRAEETFKIDLLKSEMKIAI